MREPQQVRSRETLERILAAVEELLEERDFEDLSVQEIVRRAQTSVGAFYTRFPSKEGLLPQLYRRYDERISVQFEERIEGGVEPGLDLRGRARILLGTILSNFVEQRGVIRTMGFHARRNPELLPESLLQRRSAMHRRMAGLLLECRDEIRHPDPELAVEMGLFAAASALRDKILFGGAPHARSIPDDRQLLEDEMLRLLCAYLTSPDS